MVKPFSSKKLGFSKRFFAWSMIKFGQKFDTLLAGRKQKLFSDAPGTVLEIGAGTGLNARYLKQCNELILLEPNPLFFHYLQPLSTNVYMRSVEDSNLLHDSVDTVISSMVLCSVHDIDEVLDEVARVLKPGGTYRFIEHVGAPKRTWLRMIQQIFAPVCKCLGDGCHPDRDIEDRLQNCGMKIISLERFQLPTDGTLIRHFIAGVLRKDAR